jgi:hypothetical protein
MMNLILPQLMGLLKQAGFDGEKAQAQITGAVDDLKAMHDRLARIEAGLIKAGIMPSQTDMERPQ